MRNLNENEWIVLIETIYNLNSNEDSRKMRSIFLELIKGLIPYDSAIFYIADTRGEHLLADPVVVNYDKDLILSYIEFGEELDYTWGMMQCARSMVFRDSDLMSNEFREDSEFYRRYLKPQGLHYVMQGIFSYERKFLGLVSLLRSKRNGDFSEKEIFMMDMLKDHISLRLYQEERRKSINYSDARKHLDLEIYIEKYGLTKKESDVFKLLAEGLENSEICEQLCITNHTLKKHILNIYKKTGVNSRLKLFRLVEEN